MDCLISRRSGPLSWMNWASATASSMEVVRRMAATISPRRSGVMALNCSRASRLLCIWASLLLSCSSLMSYRVTASPRMANWMAQLEPITPPPTQAARLISATFIMTYLLIAGVAGVPAGRCSAPAGICRAARRCGDKRLAASFWFSIPKGRPVEARRGLAGCAEKPRTGVICGSAGRWRSAPSRPRWRSRCSLSQRRPAAAGRRSGYPPSS